MTVIIHETNSKRTNKAFCYNASQGVVQIQEEIIKQLNAERDQRIVNFQFYYDEMEKIHENLYDGGTHILTEESQQADNYIGVIGLPNDYKVIETIGGFNGIC